MNAAHAIQTAAEIIAAAVIITGVIFENKIIIFEKRIFNKIKEAIRKQ